MSFWCWLRYIYLGIYCKFRFLRLDCKPTSLACIRDLKQRRQQNNCACSARASRFLVHFFDVHYTTMTWNLPLRRFMKDVDILRQIFSSLFEQDKALKNSTPGKVAYIWRIERFQIDAIKFETTKIHFFLVMLSLPLSSLLKVSIITGWHQNKEVNESRQPFSLGGLYVYGLSFLPKCEFASLFLLLRSWKLLNENIDIVTLLSQVHGMQ